MNALTSIPDSFSAGSTVKYSRSYAEYPTSDGWELTLHLGGKSHASIEADVVNGQFQIEITAEVSAALEPGTYHWLERVTNGDDVYDAASGVVTVTIDMATATEGQAQSWAEKTLQIVEDRLAGRLTKDMESYRIGTRDVLHIPMSELRKIRGELRIMVSQERNPDRIGRSIHVSFTRPE